MNENNAPSENQCNGEIGYQQALHGDRRFPLTELGNVIYSSIFATDPSISSPIYTELRNAPTTSSDYISSAPVCNTFSRRSFVNEAVVQSLPPGANFQNSNIVSNVRQPSGSSNIQLSTQSTSQGLVIVDISESSFANPDKTLNVNPESIKNCSKDTDDIKSNYVHQILIKSYEGRFLLAAFEYEKNPSNYNKLINEKKKTYFKRNKIAKLIINDEFERTNSLTISPERLSKLASLAADIFPGYMKESFYTESGPTKCTGGAFHYYYTKQREKEIAIGRLRVHQGKRKREDDAVQEENLLASLQVPVQIIDNDYKKNWIETEIDVRIQCYKRWDIAKIYQTLPNLAHPSGYMLVQADFCAYFNKDSDLFARKWQSLSDKIISLAKTKNDKDVRNILRNNKPLEPEKQFSDHHKQTLALFLLPYVMNRVTKLTCKSKSKKSWNPEKSVIQKTFIHHIEETVDFSASLKNHSSEILQLHNEHSLMVQPYVVINGPSLSQISSAYVIVNDYTYQFQTASQAVDVCFMCMKVFNKKPSLVCNHVWQFLEKQIYEFDVKDLYNSVITVMQQLNNMI